LLKTNNDKSFNYSYELAANSILHQTTFLSNGKATVGEGENAVFFFRYVIATFFKTHAGPFLITGQVSYDIYTKIAKYFCLKKCFLAQLWEIDQVRSAVGHLTFALRFFS